MISVANLTAQVLDTRRHQSADSEHREWVKEQSGWLTAGFIVVLVANTVNMLCYAVKKQQCMSAKFTAWYRKLGRSASEQHSPFSVSHTGDNNIKPIETIPYDLVCSDNAMHVLSCHRVLCKLDFFNRNLISSFIRMSTVQETWLYKEAGCQTGRQLLWIKVTILQWFHLLVASVTRVKQCNTTAQRDNLIMLDL